MMDQSAQSPAPREFTGRHMLAIMLAFFGVIVAVNFTMSWLAGNTWTGLVVKNSYVASQKFNAELKEARAQDSRGWKSSLTYSNGQFDFRLADKAGYPVILDNARLAIGRPAFEQQDVVLPLKYLGEGRYRAEKELAPGHWSVQVIGGADDQRFRRDDRLFVTERAGGNDG